jgi:GT2 family glycosyltransferase
VTVTYKTAVCVKESLEALGREREQLLSSDLVLRMVVVDNASGDALELDDFVARRGLGGWVDIVRAEKNGGFAYGCNVGMRFGYSLDRAPDYFFMLNPDAAVRPGAILPLVEYLQSQSRRGKGEGV